MQIQYYCGSSISLLRALANRIMTTGILLCNLKLFSNKCENLKVRFDLLTQESVVFL